MASRRSLWVFQPVGPGNVTPQALTIGDPGMIGAGTNVGGREHTDINVSMNYAYAGAQQPAATQPGEHNPLRRSFSLRNAVVSQFVLADQFQYSPDPGTVPLQGTMSDNAVMGRTQAPSYTALALEEHLFSEEDRERISHDDSSDWPIWKKVWNFKAWQAHCAAQADPKVIGQVGKILPGDQSYRPSVAGIGPQAFVVPDPRRTFGGDEDDSAGYWLMETDHEPIPWSQRQDREFIRNGSLPFIEDRVRAGAAAPSEARPARMPHWFYQSPVDKLIADRLTSQKGVVDHPQIGRPIMTKSENYRTADNAFGGTGGSQYTTPAPGMNPQGAAPNTFRQVPQPWDAALVSGQDGSTASGGSQRASNWRRL